MDHKSGKIKAGPRRLRDVTLEPKEQQFEKMFRITDLICRARSL